MLTTVRRRSGVLIFAAAVSAALIGAPGAAQAPAPPRPPDDAAARAAAVRAADRLQHFARVLTIYDRRGNIVKTVGEPGLYRVPVFSPDRTRLVVWKFDPHQERQDLWVVEVASGKATQLTSNQTEDKERVFWPVWSPDGTQIAYVALRDGRFGLYRKTATGSGSEELLYQHPGGRPFLLDWSVDGRFLAFSDTDLSGGTLFTLPLEGAAPHVPIRMFHSESRVWGSRISPDGRYLSYASMASDRLHVNVRPFEAPGADPSTAVETRVSTAGGHGPVHWRRDGKELFYLGLDRSVMAADVSTAPTFRMGAPRVLFRLPEAVVVPEMASVSPDGEQVVIAVPHAPRLQQLTVFDRAGNVLRKLGEPGRYFWPMLSPDGTRVAAMRRMPETFDDDIWVFDVASGKGTALTSDPSSEDSVIWSPDGRHLAYGSWRGSFHRIYRKAADGSGSEEPLFQYTPGAGMSLSDWSSDGRLIVFQDRCSGVLMVLPFSDPAKALERKAIDWLRDEFSVEQARFSPDMRFVAYLSDEIVAETFELYVRPFDAKRPEAGAGDTTPVRLSNGGASGVVGWRKDGKELYYLTPDGGVMSLEIASNGSAAAAPRRLFSVSPRELPFGQQWNNASRDGQRFVFPIEVPASVTPLK